MKTELKFSIPVNEFGMPLWEEDPDRQAPPA